jgi:hypothetical protein
MCKASVDDSMCPLSAILTRSQSNKDFPIADLTGMQVEISGRVVTVLSKSGVA